MLMRVRSPGWFALSCAGLLSACGPARAPEPATRPDDARAASEMAIAQVRGNVCSAREAKAAGLRAEYFAQAELGGEPVLVRMEGPIDSPWPLAGRDVSQPVQSARWRGWVRPPVSGRYAFHTDVPGATIRVSGQLLSPSRNVTTPANPTVELAAGRYHPIVVEVPRLPGAGKATAAVTGLQLSWTAPHGARYLVPKAVLFPPSETVADGRQASAREAR
jgi:hypothetical protein